MNLQMFLIKTRVLWVNEDLISHENFISLYEMEKIDATSMVTVVKDIIRRLNYEVSATMAAVSTVSTAVSLLYPHIPMRPLTRYVAIGLEIQPSFQNHWTHHTK